jgi:hypothetical protein
MKYTNRRKKLYKRRAKSYRNIKSSKQVGKGSNIISILHTKGNKKYKNTTRKGGSGNNSNFDSKFLVFYVCFFGIAYQHLPKKRHFL